jgi:hypothetical protein
MISGLVYARNYNDIAFARQSNITHMLNVEIDGTMIVALRVSDVQTKSEWMALQRSLRSEYVTFKNVIVTRDSLIYHRVSRILNDNVDEQYLTYTLRLAKERDENADFYNRKR